MVGIVNSLKENFQVKSNNEFCNSKVNSEITFIYTPKIKLNNFFNCYILNLVETCGNIIDAMIIL